MNAEGSRFTGKDLPALFLQADNASSTSQRKYLRLTKATLALLVAGAGLAAVTPVLPSCKPASAIASALLLAASVLLTTRLQVLKPEQLWYGGRAVAESAKSMAWRYMAGADPYSCDSPPSETDRTFVSALESIFKERKQLAFRFGGVFSEQPQITERMRAVRSGALGERRSTYLLERIADQRRWYGDQAQRNRSAESKYFNLIVVSQFLAFAAALALVRWPNSDIKLTGLLTCLASALIAWVQVKQHKELAQSYSIAKSSERSVSSFFQVGAL